MVSGLKPVCERLRKRRKKHKCVKVTSAKSVVPAASQIDQSLSTKAGFPAVVADIFAVAFFRFCFELLFGEVEVCDESLAPGREWLRWHTRIHHQQHSALQWCTSSSATGGSIRTACGGEPCW